MTDIQKKNSLAQESLTIIKNLVSENELVKGIFIADVRLNSEADTIIIRDVSNKEIHYSISEASCIFTDNIDMLGSFNKNVYKTVASSVGNDEMKSAFMHSYNRLKEIEKQI